MQNFLIALGCICCVLVLVFFYIDIHNINRVNKRLDEIQKDYREIKKMMEEKNGNNKN